LIALLLVLQGCAGIGQQLEQPEVKIDSLRFIPSDGLNQRFNLGLLLSNPNSVELPIAGIQYQVKLNGYDVLSGVSPDVPTLPAYSEVEVMLQGSLDLLSGLRFINSLASKPQDKLRYEFRARLDLQGLRPDVTITDEGLIDLNAIGGQPMRAERPE